MPNADAGRYDNLLRDWAVHHGATLGAPSYAATATLELWAPEAEVPRLVDDLAAASAGAIAPVLGVERIVDVPA